jgi:hypothetical protein
VVVILGAGLYVGGVFASGSGSSSPTTNAAPAPATPAPTVSAPAITTTPPTASTPTPSTAPPVSTSLQTTTYAGQVFSIEYPAGWTVKNAEVQESWGGTDTTIVSSANPDVLIRVDVSPNTTATDPMSAAQPVINSLVHQAGYKQLDLTAGTFEEFAAEHWEFVDREDGVLLQKEDEFFIDTINNDGVAVLTQAPANEYAGLASEFAKLRESLSMN